MGMGYGDMSMGHHGMGGMWNKEATCCMPGMDCWDMSYEGEAGRGEMQAELDRLLEELPGIKDHFMELNADNLKKESAEKQKELAEQRKDSKKLQNKIADANTVLTEMEADQATEQVDKDTQRLLISDMQHELDMLNESYARLDEEDASMQLEGLKYEEKKMTESLAERKAAVEWQTTVVAGLLAAADAASEEESVAKQAAYQEGQTALDELSAGVAGTTDLLADLAAQIADMTARQDGAATFLLEAEEKRAQILIAQKEAEIAEFKVSYDALKAEYDTIAAKDDQGTATDSDYKRLDELEITYKENQAMFDAMETDRLHRVKDNLEKAYNKEKSAYDKMKADVADK